jgi:predicted P-loop ATPase
LIDPGCKFDEMLILESKQGTGKSTALSIMAVREEWFTDNLPLNADCKTVIEQTTGFWIVECAELQGLKQARWEGLKSMLSRRVDVARLAFGRHRERRARQWIPVGTTNGDTYLSDPTGNRRFWPVRCQDEQIDLERLRKDRDQLWAEAVARERYGESIGLPPELWGAAAEAQEQRMLDDAVYTKLQEKLEEFEEGRITVDTIWDLLLVTDLTQQSQLIGKVKHAMTRLGWQMGKDKGRIMVRGERVKGWSKGTGGRGRGAAALLEIEWGGAGKRLVAAADDTPEEVGGVE